LAVARRRSLRRSGLFAPLLLSVGTTAALVLIIVAAEVSLRAVGFEHRTFPLVQFGWPRPEQMADLYVADRDLFWVPRDHGTHLGSGRMDRPAVAFVGDSCTQFGIYPERTVELLGGMNPRLSSGINLGVGGWSAVQGLTLLKRDVLQLRPSVVTFYFGWNDHWTALGAPDDEARSGAVAWYLSQNSRLFRLLLKARLAATLLEPQAGRPRRVDLATYKETLREMARVCQRAGIRPVLITAPSNHRPGREPRYLAERHLRRLDELVPLHLAYVQATREAARESGAVLCDAAEAFSRATGQRARYFRSDGIHLTVDGDMALARLLAGCIVESMGPSSASTSSGWRL
jgi:lysophospholipase L1-like esterase